MPRLEGETYFNNFGQSGYDELKDWTPRYYQDIKEADTNLRFAGKTKDLMAAALEDFCRNQFAKTMDEEELTRMEAYFYMEENGSLDIEERRRLLAIAMSGTGKINTKKIADIVRTYTGAESTFYFMHKLYIYIHLDQNSRIGSPDKLRQELRGKMPAHIAYVTNYHTELFIDERGERFEDAKVKCALAIPFWYSRVLNGDWLLDGTYNLDEETSYRLRLAVRSIFGFNALERTNMRAAIKNAVRGQESVSAWLTVPLDIEEGGEDLRARATARTKVAAHEGYGGATATTFSPGYWFLDGEVTLNGTKNLNSIYEKEDIL